MHFCDHHCSASTPLCHLAELGVDLTRIQHQPDPPPDRFKSLSWPATFFPSQVCSHAASPPCPHHSIPDLHLTCQGLHGPEPPSSALNTMGVSGLQEHRWNPKLTKAVLGTAHTWCQRACLPGLCQTSDVLQMFGTICGIVSWPRAVKAYTTVCITIYCVPMRCDAVDHDLFTQPRVKPSRPCVSCQVYCLIAHPVGFLLRYLRCSCCMQQPCQQANWCTHWPGSITSRSLGAPLPPPLPQGSPLAFPFCH